MAPIKFYHNFLSGPSRGVLLTIRSLNLDVEIETLDLLKQAQLAPEFVKINPQHTVPTIDDNGFVLWESRAIVSYLVSAKAPGSSLYPTDVKKRALVDARLYLDQSLQLVMSSAVYVIFTGEATKIPVDKKQKLFQILEHFNTFLEGKKYAAGDELTVADLALLGTISTLYELGANVSKYTNIDAWYKRLESIPGHHENLEGAKALAQYIITKPNFNANIEVLDLFNKAQLSPEFVKKNPQHTVPTIEDNGFILWESRAIASYLVSAKAPGSSLYPTDPKKKAIVDARLYLDQALQLALSAIVFPIHTQGATTIEKDKKDKAYQILENLNTFMEGKPYAAGNELTIADLALLATISSLYEMGANIPKFKNIMSWYKKLESIPGFKENGEGAKGLGDYILL
uniref:glutathione transferase n=1 Tax=Phlebotomus papatasi TaxID=29031 RepID=A0A1B0F0C7_PHLPP